MPEGTAVKSKVSRSNSEANKDQNVILRDKSKKASKTSRRKTTDGTVESPQHDGQRESLNGRSSADSTVSNKQRTASSVSRHASTKVRTSTTSNNGDKDKDNPDAIIDEEEEDPLDTEHQRTEKRRLKTRGSFVDRMRTAWRNSTTSLKRSSSLGKLSFSNLFGSSRRHRGSTTSLRNANPENVTDVGQLDGYGESDVLRCAVSMLDGLTRQFRIDKRECTGGELLNAVAAYLNLAEKEYFGLVYFDKREVWYWLAADKKVNEQLDGLVPFLEFQCRFYPIDPRRDLKEDLSRYYLALQVRQDVLSGKLPCSFLSFAILGAYAVQADLGDQADFDTAFKGGSQNRHTADGKPEERSSHIKDGEYLKEYPLAPSSMQTTQLLEKTSDLHNSIRGMLPEDCDVALLDEARKLALYGMDLHRARDERGVEVMLGINGHGIVVYRDRLRVHVYTWPRIIKVSYKRTTLTITLRNDQFGAAGGWRSMDSRTDLSTFLGSTMHNGRTTEPNSSFYEIYRLRSYKLAKRCWRTVVEQHGFFRLHAPDLPQPPKRPLFKRLTTSMRDLTGTYSGTTQAQLRDRDLGREAPNVRRSSSIRHSGGALGSWTSMNSLRRSQSLLMQSQNTPTADVNGASPTKQLSTPKLPPRRVEVPDGAGALAAEDDDLETVAKPPTGQLLMAVPSPSVNAAPAPATFHSETTVQIAPKPKRRKSKLPTAVPEETPSDKIPADKYREFESRILQQLSDQHAKINLSEQDQIERSEFLLIKQKSTAQVVYVDEDGEPVDGAESDQAQNRPPLADEDDDDLL